MNLQKTANGHPARIAGLVFSTCCYLVFLFTFFYLIGFVGGVVVPKHINSGPLISWPLAILINCLLMLLFGAQHSVMARKGFKRWLTTFIPPVAERSTYVLLSSLVLVLMFWLWRPITFTVWQVEAAWARVLLTGLFWLGWVVVFGLQGHHRRAFAGHRHLQLLGWQVGVQVIAQVAGGNLAEVQRPAVGQRGATSAGRDDAFDREVSAAGRLHNGGSGQQ